MSRDKPRDTRAGQVIGGRCLGNSAGRTSESSRAREKMQDMCLGWVVLQGVLC